MRTIWDWFADNPSFIVGSILGAVGGVWGTAKMFFSLQNRVEKTEKEVKEQEERLKQIELSAERAHTERAHIKDSIDLVQGELKEMNKFLREKGQ